MHVFVLHSFDDSYRLILFVYVSLWFFRSLLPLLLLKKNLNEFLSTLSFVFCFTKIFLQFFPKCVCAFWFRKRIKWEKGSKRFCFYGTEIKMIIFSRRTKIPIRSLYHWKISCKVFYLVENLLLGLPLIFVEWIFLFGWWNRDLVSEFPEFSRFWFRLPILRRVSFTLFSSCFSSISFVIVCKIDKPHFKRIYKKKFAKKHIHTLPTNKHQVYIQRNKVYPKKLFLHSKIIWFMANILFLVCTNRFFFGVRERKRESKMLTRDLSKCKCNK